MSMLRKILRPFMIVAPYVLRSSQTVAYPDDRLVFSERFRGRHRFYFDRCIHCGTCARVCPCDSIAMIPSGSDGGQHPQINYGTCSLCGYCVEFCPTKALEFTDLVEYSEYVRKDLIYSPEKLAQVPNVKELVPRLKRRIEAYLTDKEMKYRKVSDV